MATEPSSDPAGPPVHVVRAWAHERFPGRTWPWTVQRTPKAASRLSLSARAAAVASGGLLATGLAVGIAGGPGPDPAVADGDGDAIVVVARRPAPAVGLPVPLGVMAVADEQEDVPAVQDEPVPADTAEVVASPADAPEQQQQPAPQPVDAPSDEPAPQDTAGDEEPPVEEEPAGRLPAFTHVSVVWMADGHGERTFGPDSPMPYVAGPLAAQGLVLPRYHGTSGGSLPNGTALLAGLAATPEQRADCPTPTPVVPATVRDDGQVTGEGCRFPATIPTVLDQLTAKGRSWKVYAGDLSAGGTDVCRAPQLGVPDLAGTVPRPGDGFASARVPALWFSSITDGPGCQSVVDLVELDADLGARATVPDFSLIVPSVCDAGGAVECPDGRASGPAAADAFLAGLIPRLTAAPGFAEGGLVVVVWDRAPADGTVTDVRRCCSGRPAGIEGGGRTGAVVLSPFVSAGTVQPKPYDHIALLRTIEEIFGLEPLGFAASPGVEGFGPKVFAGVP